jgi:hypothetical protein
MANAFGPMGDITHRHLYKDQQWIWQKEQTLPKAEASKDVGTQISLPDISNSPVAFLVPNHPSESLAFLVPNHPSESLAFLVPNHPSSAS